MSLSSTSGGAEPSYQDICRAIEEEADLDAFLGRSVDEPLTEAQQARFRDLVGREVDIRTTAAMAARQ